MPLRDDLLQPIAGDNPSGANIRYDPVVEKIKEARREELDLDQGVWKTAVKTADWPQVIKLSSDVLVKRSKDLQIAVWLVEAHIRREGFAQLGPGFTFIRSLLEQFWDTLYPELEDGDAELRCGPLDYLGNKLDVPLRQLPITSNKLSWQQYQESRKVGYEKDADSYQKQQEREARIKENKITAEQFDEAIDGTSMGFYASLLTALNDGLTAIGELHDLCEERFGDEGPSFTGTRKALEDISQTVELLLRKKGGAVPVKSDEDEPEPEPQVSTASSSSSVRLDDDFSFALASSDVARDTPVEPDTSGADQDSVSSDDDSGSTAQMGSIEPQSDDDVVRQLEAVCRYLLNTDKSNPAPYMIIRGYRWGELRQRAPTLDSWKLVPPPTETRVELKELFARRDWDEFIPAAEKAMTHPSGRGWLDIHRYTIFGLEDKGYYPAAKAVRDGLKNLLADIPTLLKATMLDDTPVASPDTLKWIEEDLMSDRPAPGFEPPPEPAAATDDSASDYSSSDYSASDTSTDTDSTPSDDLYGGLGTDTPTETTEETPAEPAPAPGLDIEFPAVDETPPILPEPEQEESSEPKELFEQAMDTVTGGNAAEGLKMISDRLASERCERSRFRRRTQMAHLLLMGGHTRIAQPMLDQLAAEIEQRRLDDWEEGQIVAYPLELLLRCIASDGGDPEKSKELYARICKLDPVRALNYTIKNG